MKILELVVADAAPSAYFRGRPGACMVLCAGSIREEARMVLGDGGGRGGGEHGGTAVSVCCTV